MIDQKLDAIFEIGKTYFLCRFMDESIGLAGILVQKHYDTFIDVLFMKFFVDGKIEHWEIDASNGWNIEYADDLECEYILAEDHEGNNIPIYLK